MNFSGDEREVGARQQSQPVESGASGSGDLELEQALKNFRQSVVAWSDAAYSRPRAIVQAQAAPHARHRSWRLAAGYALSIALLAGAVAGVGYERHQRLETARIAAARAAEQQKMVSEQQGLVREEQARADEEDLLAKVDSDVSREVPNAMEPLAQLMAEDERQ
jgi:hypothetical protein